MSNQGRAYVERLRARGCADKEIRDKLARAGWTPQQVEALLQPAQRQTAAGRVVDIVLEDHEPNAAAPLANVVYCQNCHAQVQPEVDYCPSCGAPCSFRARQQQSTPSQADGHQQQTTVQVVQHSGSPWWIIGAILGAPVGCLALCLLLPGMLMLFTYGLPFVLSAGVAAWIWYKHPGTRQERMRWVIISLVSGAVLNAVLLIVFFSIIMNSNSTPTP